MRTHLFRRPGYRRGYRGGRLCQQENGCVGEGVAIAKALAGSACCNDEYSGYHRVFVLPLVGEEGSR